MRLGVEVCAADFPAPAVVAGLEAQPLHDFPCGLGRIGVANVDGAAVEVVAVDRVHHGTHHAFAAAPSAASHSAISAAPTGSVPVLTTAKSLVMMQGEETSAASQRCCWLGWMFRQTCGLPSS